MKKEITLTKKIDSLDSKDRKILSILSNNSRTPISIISKKIKLSRDAIKYRIKNYEANGIINGYRTIVDISLFGFNNYHLFIKLNNPSTETENEIENKLKSNSFVRSIINYNGYYDLEIAIIAKNISELDTHILTVLTELFDVINGYDILIITKNYIQETFPLDFTENKIIQNETINKKITIEKKDLEILQILGDNADRSLLEMGNRLKISPDTVSYRIKNMISSGIITKFIPSIDYDRMGYTIYCALVNISILTTEKEGKLREYIYSDRNIIWAVKVIGKYNLVIYYLTKDIKETQESIIRLRQCFPKDIREYEILIAYKVQKYSYFPQGLII